MPADSPPTNHLRLPWRRHGIALRDADGQRIARFEAIVEDEAGDDARAEYVVRAANAQEQLLAACRAALAYLACPQPTLESEHVLISAIRTALHAASEQPVQGSGLSGVEVHEDDGETD